MSEDQSNKQATTSYQEWIDQVQISRNANWKMNVALHESGDTEYPPSFDHVTLFHDGVEDYATANTTLVSEEVQSIARDTNEAGLFAPCMVGTLESQFLKLQVQVSGARRVLDIGTFTGMSALAMSEGLPDDDPESCVVTLENIDACADVAEACFAKAGPAGARIKLIRGNALESIQKLKSGGEKFDVIFIDADKENYIHYYKAVMDGKENMLTPRGFIMADNSMCALLYGAKDTRSKSLHDFNQFVKGDDRVDQVILTVREGITLIKPKKLAK